MKIPTLEDMKIPILQDFCSLSPTMRTGAEEIIAELGARVLELTRQSNNKQNQINNLECMLENHCIRWETVAQAAQAVMNNVPPEEPFKSVLERIEKAGLFNKQQRG